MATSKIFERVRMFEVAAGEGIMEGLERQLWLLRKQRNLVSSNWEKRYQPSLPAQMKRREAFSSISPTTKSTFRALLHCPALYLISTVRVRISSTVSVLPIARFVPGLGYYQSLPESCPKSTPIFISGVSCCITS